jgi:hypothetical protein
MRRLLVLTVLLALAGSSIALAGRGDPQERFTPADQARAKSMLLRQADLDAGFRATPITERGDSYCKALDVSDLTLTAESVKRFARGSVGILSLAQVYESPSDANASWRRGTSKAGEKCFGDALRRQLTSEGVRDVTFQRLAFPRLAQRSDAYRLVGFVHGVPAFVDIVVVQQSRAHAALFMASVLQPVVKHEQVRLARIVAGRMAKSMRGA